jgi:protein tyrosine phosphatase (PTP) superfamily phosphohydrolase (DUF442 family)
MTTTRTTRSRTLRSALGLGLVGAALALACTSPESEPQDLAVASRPVPPPLGPLEGTAYDAALRVELPKVDPAEDHGLHNVYKLGDEIVSGSEPHGEDAFKKLRELGIRTILSVDGKVPDEALARKYGMHYVHVPIQYSGINEDELTRISKTFREQDGPFYVHCFHGKHRGPAAAAVGRLVLDGVPREEALAEMRQWCGTSQSYEGLYQTIAESGIPSEQETRAYRWDFPAAHPLAGFRAAMIEISRADDNVKYLSRHGWKPTADHPDVDPLNEATKLASAFERADVLHEVAARPADFRGWMKDSVDQTRALREAIAAFVAGDGTVEAADAAYRAVAESCSACHEVYRNEL